MMDKGLIQDERARGLHMLNYSPGCKRRNSNKDVSEAGKS